MRERGKEVMESKKDGEMKKGQKKIERETRETR